MPMTERPRMTLMTPTAISDAPYSTRRRGEARSRHFHRALAGDLQEHLFHRRLVEGGATEDAPRHLERRALGDDVPAMQEDDPVAHLLHFGHVVRRVENGEAARAPDVLE